VIAAAARRRRLFAVGYINRPFAWKESFSTLLQHRQAVRGSTARCRQPRHVKSER
jgi:hypothetical protein